MAAVAQAPEGPLRGPILLAEAPGVPLARSATGFVLDVLCRIRLPGRWTLRRRCTLVEPRQKLIGGDDDGAGALGSPPHFAIIGDYRPAFAGHPRQHAIGRFARAREDDGDGSAATRAPSSFDTVEDHGEGVVRDASDLHQQ